jgi:hypothetical protein
VLTTIQLVGPFGHRPSHGVPALVLKLAVFDNLPELSPMLRYGIQTASVLHISETLRGKNAKDRSRAISKPKTERAASARQQLDVPGEGARKR